MQLSSKKALTAVELLLIVVIFSIIVAVIYQVIIFTLKYSKVFQAESALQQESVLISRHFKKHVMNSNSVDIDNLNHTLSLLDKDGTISGVYTISGNILSYDGSVVSDKIGSLTFDDAKSAGNLNNIKLLKIDLNVYDPASPNVSQPSTSSMVACRIGDMVFSGIVWNKTKYPLMDRLFSKIQDAITDASANDILLCSGSFNESVVIRKSLSLKGGYDSTFDEADRDIANNSTIVTKNGSNAIFIDGDTARRVTIEGFAVKDSDLGIYINSWGAIGIGVYNILNNKIINNKSPGLMIANSKDTYNIKNNIFKNNGFQPRIQGNETTYSNGVHIAGDCNNINLKFFDNMFENNALNGLLIMNVEPSNITIANNIFSKNGYLPHIDEGEPLFKQYGNGCTIFNCRGANITIGYNIFNENGNDGLYIGNGDNANTQISVEKNNFTNNGLLENIISGSSSYGSGLNIGNMDGAPGLLLVIDIKNNSISGSGGCGMRFANIHEGAKVYLDNNNIAGNFTKGIDPSSGALSFYNGHYGSIFVARNNIVSGNNSAGISFGNVYSDATRKTDISLFNNLIYGNLDHSIRVSNGNGSVFTFANNTTAGNTNGTEFDSSSGITVTVHSSIAWDDSNPQISGVLAGSITNSWIKDALPAPPDPLFVDAGSSNYLLQNTSPCIDMGKTVINPALPASNYFDPALSLSTPPNPAVDLAKSPAKGFIKTDIGAYGGPGAANPIGTYAVSDNPATTDIREDVIGTY